MNFLSYFYEIPSSNGVQLDTISFLFTAIGTWALFIITWRQFRSMSREAWRGRIIEIIGKYTGHLEFLKIYRLQFGHGLCGRETEITILQKQLSLLLVKKKYLGILEKVEELRVCADTYNPTLSMRYNSLEDEIYSLVKKAIS